MSLSCISYFTAMSLSGSSSTLLSRLRRNLPLAFDEIYPLLVLSLAFDEIYQSYERRDRDNLSLAFDVVEALEPLACFKRIRISSFTMSRLL